MAKPSPRTLILFDFDELLALTQKYLEIHLTPILKKHLDPDNAHADEAFFELTQRLYREHGTPVHGWALLYGHSEEWITKIQAITNREVGEVIRPFFKPDPAINAILEELVAKGHVLAVVTHGHRDYTVPFLQHLGLGHVFPPERVFDISMLKGGSKQTEAAYILVEKALAHLGPFFYRVMFEDSILNLIAPKKRGYITYLVRQERVTQDLTYAVDHHFHRTFQALAHLNSYM